MRPAALLLALALSGCWSWTDEDEGLPEIKPKVGAADNYADATDLVMSRAAASVEVARQANRESKPDLVESELAIAGNYLPRPTAPDLAQAKARAAKPDPKDYEKAQAEADAKSRALDDLWAKVEAEKAKAAAALEAKEMELVQARKDKAATLFSLFGVAAVGVGLALFIWGSKIGASKPEAGAVILAGVAAGSLPWLTEAAVAPWILGGLGVVLAIRVAAWAWFAGWKGRP